MGIERTKIEGVADGIRVIHDSGDWSGYADFFAEEVTYTNSALPEPIHGRETLRSYTAYWPKVVNRIEWTAIDGNRLVVGWNERQEAMRADATAYRGISTYVFNDDGLIVSYEGMFDPAALAAASAS